jgi:hypothetical protein
MRRFLLSVSLVLMSAFGPAIGAEKTIRLTQNPSALSPPSFACVNNCNTQYLTCSNQCPTGGTLSQNQPDINAGQVITQNRIDLLQNTQPIQCRLNCTSQQQSCYATCR